MATSRSLRNGPVLTRDSRVVIFTPDLLDVPIARQEDFVGHYRDWQSRRFILSRFNRATELTLLVRLTRLPPEEVVANPDINEVCSLCIENVDGRPTKTKRIELMGFQRQVLSINSIRGGRSLVASKTDARTTVTLTYPGKLTWDFLFNRYMAYYTGDTGSLLSASGSPSIVGYLLPLCAIPNMSQDLERYWDSPDPRGVQFVEPIGPNNAKPTPDTPDYVDLVGVDSEVCSAFGYPTADDVYKCPVNSPGAATEVVNTVDELQALAFVHLFLMVKRGQDAHVSMALKRRLSALRQAAGLESLNVDNFMERFVRPSIMIAAADRLSFYPNLKAIVFSSIIAQDSPFHNYAKEILKDSQLTVFNMIVLFCGAQHLTMLHVFDMVLAEYDRFCDARDTLARTYGEQTWHFCKLLNPDEDLATLSRFPELAKAAKAYMLTHHHMDSLRNLQGMRDVPRLYYQLAGQPVIAAVRVDIAVVRQRLGRIAPPEVVNSITEAMLLDGRRAAEERQLDPHIVAFMAGRPE